MSVTFIFLLISGYLLGSIPFGKLVAAQYGIDIQKRGSGNIGFANVRRVLGWKAGVITLACDIAKGLLPSMIALVLVDEMLAFWVGLCAIIGHIFPLWLHFKGGKGIATGLGVVLVLHPLAALTGVGAYLVGCSVFRKSSTGSLIGLFTVAGVAVTLSPASWWQYGLLLTIALWALRHNIRGTVPDYDI